MTRGKNPKNLPNKQILDVRHRWHRYAVLMSNLNPISNHNPKCERDQGAKAVLITWACVPAALCSRHTWPRPSLLRYQRDQARLLYPPRARLYRLPVPATVNVARYVTLRR